MFSLTVIVATFVAALQSPVNAPASADDRQALVGGIASAVAEATCSEAWSDADWCRPVWPASRLAELAALVVVIGYYESALDPRIGRTACRLTIGECDAEPGPGGARRAGSVGYWQTKRFLYGRDELREAVGSAGEWAVYLQAQAAVRALAGAAGACGPGPSLRAAISGYATGGATLGARCSWSGARRREATVRWLLGRARPPAEPISDQPLPIASARRRGGGAGRGTR